MARLGTLALASLVAVAVLVGGGYWFLVRTAAGQDFLLDRMAGAVLAGGLPAEFDGLRVFMCGTSGPLVAPGRAQTCVAITAGDSLYLFDAGEGSADVAQLHGLPTETLRAVFVTHMHSDHIAGINNFNLASWVQGRKAPLKVMGPAGIERVVAGFNEAFAIDRGYRVAHHGEDFLPPALGVMHAEVISPGVVMEANGLRVAAFAVDHGPVKPAYGFRIDFRGRSVVVVGDTIATASLTAAAKGADLLLHDALSLPIIAGMEAAARNAGRIRAATILHDIQDYHAHAAHLAPLAQEANVRMLALYHFVPAPRNHLLEQIFRRDLPTDAVFTTEGMVFELPAGGTDIHVR